MLNSLRKNVEISGWGLERAGLRAEPYIDFKDLRHDWEAVPFQKSNAKSFPQAVKQVLPFAFTLALLSLFMVEDNSVSLVPAFVPACGCQRSR
jgi:hypothetical protein